MQRLAGSDAGFLFIESPTQTSTCVDLVVLGPAADGSGALTVDGLRRHLAERLHLVPSLRWRLQPIPLGIGHPVWVDDPDFDLDYHIRHEILPAPGDEPLLDALIARALPGILDHRHPLWQVILVDGLADGRQALVFRFHHSMADGAALIALFDRLLGSAPTAIVEPWRAAPMPRPWKLFLTTLAMQLRAWLATPRLLIKTLGRFKAVENRRASAPVAVPRSMGDAPRCSLNQSSDANRVFAKIRVPLADLQQVRTASGASVSDVVLAMVAGGLRSYLHDRGGLPDGPLVANVPVGIEAAGTPPRQTGNVFANYFSYLGTDIADPVQRLQSIVAANNESKHQLDVLGFETLPAWLDRIPPFVAGPASKVMSRRQRTGAADPDFNVLVSNVRVPPSAWSLGTRPVERICMSGPVADGAGLNVTVTGFGEDVHLAVVANPSAIAEPAALVAALADALAELKAALAGRPASPATNRPNPRTVQA